jgi:putative hydrolase of the HAD superfamily
MPPKVLYFDLGNVLLGFSHERMCRQMADLAGITAEAVRELLFADEGPDCAQWQIEDGRLDVEGYYRHFCAKMGRECDRARLEIAASDIFWPLEETAALVRKLAAAKHRLGILSNINPLHWRFVSDGRFPLLHRAGQPGSLFEFVVLSYEAKAMKPDQRIYQAAVDLTGAPADQVFFVDDRADNVAGALAAGLDAVPFVGVDQLVADLKQRGVCDI